MLPTFGEWVAMHRKRRGLTQPQLAAAVNVSYSYLQKLEQGTETNPGDQLVTILCRFFDLDENEYIHVQVMLGRRYPGLAGAPTDTVAWNVLEAWSPNPASCVEDWRVIRDRTGKLMVNTAFRRVWPGMAEARSVPDWWFRDPLARQVAVDWEGSARMIVGMVRNWAAAPINARRASVLVGPLMQHPLWRHWWEEGVVHAAGPYPLRRIRLLDSGAEMWVQDAILMWPWSEPGRLSRSLYVGTMTPAGLCGGDRCVPGSCASCGASTAA